jgi:hypothetical protein
MGLGAFIGPRGEGLVAVRRRDVRRRDRGRVGVWPDEHAGAGDTYPRSGDRVSVSFMRFDHGGRTSLARF